MRQQRRRAEPVAFNQSQSSHYWPNKIGFSWCNSFVLVPTFMLANCVEFLLPINGACDSIFQFELICVRQCANTDNAGFPDICKQCSVVYQYWCC